MSKKVFAGLVLSLAAIVTIGVAVALAAKPGHAHTGRPVDRRLPRISGSPEVSRMLHASSGRWAGASELAYEWKRCNARGTKCKLIRHRPAKRAKLRLRADAYRLTRADLGHRIRVTVIATNGHGSTTATSRPTGIIKRTATASASPAPPSSPGSGAGSGSITRLHVVGNHLIDANGQTVVLHGTDVSGTSYACEQNGGYGFSDTPTGDTLSSAMVSNAGGKLPKDWTINSATLLLNQDCWLGINGVKAQYSGQNYINFVKSQVASLEKYGIYPVLVFGEGTDSGEPNYYNDDGQVSMPNNNHFPLLEEELATEFRGDPDVIFRLFEEPFPDGVSESLTAWKCWSQGDDQYATTSDSTLPAGWESSPGTQTAPTPTSSTSHCNETDGNGVHYATVGMQSLLNIIRGTGATNIIQIPGVAYANALSCTNSGSPIQCGFLDSTDGVKVNDTLNPPQLMADTDNYPDTGQFVNSLASLEATYGVVAGVMPIDMGEIGTMSSNGTDTLAEQFINEYDVLGQSYYGSQWETWSNFISNYNGAPGTGWGTWFYDHITGANCSVSSGC